MNPKERLDEQQRLMKNTVDSETYMSAGMQTILKFLIETENKHGTAIVECEKEIEGLTQILKEKGIIEGT